MEDLVYLKLGGSLITDKKGNQNVRLDVLKNLATQIRDARELRPKRALVLGHGSGSFGHVAAAKYGTRVSVNTKEEWYGFTEVRLVAARLNSIVMDAMLEEGLPAISFQPSASALCHDGRLVDMDSKVIEVALRSQLIPVIYGDVAFDDIRGGTIVSTEEIMSFLASKIPPTWLLLAGETAGVLDQEKKVIPIINNKSIVDIQSVLQGSSGTDVTGGMETKVFEMLTLVNRYPNLRVRIFSGLEPGTLQEVYLKDDSNIGTLITQ